MQFGKFPWIQWFILATAYSSDITQDQSGSSVIKLSRDVTQDGALLITGARADWFAQA